MKFRSRRLILFVAILMVAGAWLVINPDSYEKNFTKIDYAVEDGEDSAVYILSILETKEKSSTNEYKRNEFYSTWPNIDGCSLRQKIIKRDFKETAILDKCDVVAGEYDEPYTGEHKKFSEKSEISSNVQIDHVVALSNAWQTGAESMTKEERFNLATDPLNLIAVDSKENKKKSDGDASEWLPPNKKFHCQYVARQISVKYRYHLWVTTSERATMEKTLENCPNEKIITSKSINGV